MTHNCNFDIYSFKDNEVSERLELHSVMTVLIGEKILNKMQKRTIRILKSIGVQTDLLSKIVLLGLALHDLGKALPQYQKSNKEKLSFFNHEIYSFYFAIKILFSLNINTIKRKEASSKQIVSIIIGTALAILRHHQAMREKIRVILDLCKIKNQLQKDEVPRYIFCAINKISRELLNTKNKIASDIGKELGKIDYVKIKDWICGLKNCGAESQRLQKFVNLCYHSEGNDPDTFRVSYHSYYLASQILLISDNISAFLTRNGYNLDDFCRLDVFRRKFVRKIAQNIKKIICEGV
ncbi:MAG: hypothetical protein ACP6IQ_06390 [Candidatus Njordarchaeia archaeon]